MIPAAAGIFIGLSRCGDMRYLNETIVEVETKLKMPGVMKISLRWNVQAGEQAQPSVMLF